VFSHFGPVESVKIVTKSMALVKYKDIVSAWSAQQSLHNYCLPNLQAKLSVRYYVQNEEHQVQKPNIERSSSPKEWESKGNCFNSNGASATAFVERRSQVEMANAKYTCRYDIQIENDKEFQVARKLIGAKVTLSN